MPDDFLRRTKARAAAKAKAKAAAEKATQETKPPSKPAEKPAPSLKEIIDGGRYDEALALLKKSKHPNAPKLIAEVERRIAAQVTAAKATSESSEVIENLKAKAKPKTNWRRIRIYVLAASCLFLALVVYQFIQANNAAGRDIRIYFRVSDVCQEVYREARYDGRYTSNQYISGCFTAAEHSISKYSEEVNYCYDNQNETLARFMSCLADNNFKLDEIWLLAADKE